MGGKALSEFLPIVLEEVDEGVGVRGEDDDGASSGLSRRVKIIFAP